jgi:hypothetical protein
VVVDVSFDFFKYIHITELNCILVLILVSLTIIITGDLILLKVLCYANTCGTSNSISSLIPSKLQIEMPTKSTFYESIFVLLLQISSIIYIHFTIRLYIKTITFELSFLYSKLYFFLICTLLFFVYF